MVAPGHRHLVAQVVRHRDVHRHVRERRLAPAGGHVQVIDELPDGLAHFRVAHPVAENEGRQVSVERAERLRARPFRLQNAEEVGHLAQGFAEMARRAARDAAHDSVEAFAQQLAQAPSGAIARKAVQIVDVIVARAVRPALFRVIDFVEPEVGDYFARYIIYQPRVAVAHVRVRVNPPVGFGQVFVDRFRAVDSGSAILFRALYGRCARFKIDDSCRGIVEH